MRAHLIGLITQDILVSVQPDLKPVCLQTFGGIVHSAAALAAHGVEATVVSTVGKRELQEVVRRFGLLPCLDLSAIRPIDFPTPRCSLFWPPGSAEPVEQTLTHGKPMAKRYIEAILGGGGQSRVYVNFMLGHDIRVKSARALGKKWSVYLDPHMFLYRRDAIGARVLEPPDGWSELLATADYIQLNCTEFLAVCKAAGVPKGSIRKCIVDLMTRLRGGGKRPKGVIVTGSRQVVRCHEDAGGFSVRTYSVDACNAAVPFHTVGCGDVFGAGVFSGLLGEWTANGLDAGIRRGMIWAREAMQVPGVATRFVS